ncbi:mitochondrial substrate carrier family protein [Arabidopsis lyrata subsp. lyrata]|uniref:Mitochondrial substrate carrier family protein n=1 Tax=Arabidopsis lyrata subsp. lyrata TaxID=81972 RepID=D7MDQ2_ARALL|nr:mitochondrial carrier protein MTM1 [Arabidopsis lyrata subsp. lyrata]EFH45789.1 mitochondrial substrate carrier family protein [Arabidopsis lyrata subsp. lyrata]|eukprot:XP_002869530.1 mitochondrial carrier protein MTM1 [Arabidopsis lyrata subsp. lyrata]
MVEAERAENSWIASEMSSSSSPAAIESRDFSIIDSTNGGIRDVSGFGIASRPQLEKGLSENNIGFTERVFSAAGAAVLSAVTLNPLDVVKTRLQAQAAGMSYSHPLSNSIGRMAFFGPNMMFADLRCSPSCSRAGVQGTVSICPPDCFQYKGTFDVFTKIIRQEGLARLWRGTNAGLALAVPMVGIYLPFYDMFRNRLEELSREKAPAMTFCVPTVAGSLARSLACTVCYPIDLARTRMQAFKEAKAGVKPPGVFKTLVGVFSEVRTANNLESSLHNYRVLWRGLGAQLARDVPFSAICWSTLEPIKKRLLGVAGNDTNLLGVFGATFSAGFIAGSIAAASTCPLDVARTRRQIEKDPGRALIMTTRQTLIEVWRDGGMRGLFMGMGPRVARAGPSVGIVVSFYEVVKYVLHRHASS